MKMVQCAGCDRPILDRFLLNVLDRSWHTKCVQCCDCRCNLTDKCFSRDGKLFCRNDFFKRFGTKCAGCSLGISPTDLVRRARSKVFHLKCFTCLVCRKQLSTGEELYVLDEHRFVCKDDYLARHQQPPPPPPQQQQPPQQPPPAVLGPSGSPGDATLDLDDPSDGADADLLLRDQDRDSSVERELTPGGGAASPSACGGGAKGGGNASVANGPKPDPGGGGGSGPEGAGGPATGDEAQGGTKRRGPRTTIKAKQLETLKAAFAATPKPTRHIREQLAQETGLNMRVIQVTWATAAASPRVLTKG